MSSISFQNGVERNLGVCIALQRSDRHPTWFRMKLIQKIPHRIFRRERKRERRTNNGTRTIGTTITDNIRAPHESPLGENASAARSNATMLHFFRPFLA